MKAALVAISLVALMGCTKKLEGAPEWQNALLSSDVEAQWGALGTKYVELSPWQDVEGEDLTALRGMFGTPAHEGATTCLVHIDGKLRADGTEVMVCLGCGQIFMERHEYTFGSNKELRALMTRVLGPRPKEPDLFPGL